jgi:hypothetical protein
MTINKAQGQTLRRVGLFLPSAVFSHGQLYVALSRVATSADLRVVLEEAPGQGHFDGHEDVPAGAYTANVVWPEALLGRGNPLDTPASRPDIRAASDGVDVEEEGGHAEGLPPSAAVAVGLGLAEGEADVEEGVGDTQAAYLDENSEAPLEFSVPLSLAAAVALAAVVAFQRNSDDTNDCDEFGSDPSTTVLAGSVFAPSGSECAAGASILTDNVRQENAFDVPQTKAPELLNRPTDLAIAPPRYVGYFERQHLARCGLHALNNAVGGSFFTPQDMTAACTAFLEEARHEGLPERRSDHESSTGWYSVEVLAYVVRWKIAQEAMGAHTHMSLDVNQTVAFTEASLREIYDDDVLGVIVNKNNTHWVSFKCVSGVLWLLDSQQAPEPYTFSEYTRFLAEYPNAFSLRDDMCL